MKARPVMVLAIAVLGASVASAGCDGRVTPSGVHPAGQPSAATDNAGARPPADQGQATAQAKGVGDVTSFDEYPLLCLGPSYDSDGDGVGDMPLSHADATNYPERLDPLHGTQISPAIRSFSLVYGWCVIPPNQSECAVPVSIDIYPGDNQLPPPVGALGGLRVRGVDARVFDGGSLWIETGDFTVSIPPAFAKGKDKLMQSLRIASLLHAGNSKAAGITDDTEFKVKGAKDATAPSASATAPPP